MATKEKAQEPLSYFQKRMDLLGITPEINKIGLLRNKLEDGQHKDVIVEEPIFRETELGIDIIVYDLQRQLIQTKPDGSRWSKTFAITRLKEPVEKNGQVMKYRIPKGAGTYPFFPPQLIEKYEKKIPMKTVFLTEGYFKAFKGAMHGLDIIGLSSITHMKERGKELLHEDIVKLIKSGLVEQFVWLVDGDCLDITQKEITEDKDLSIRPKNFFSSVATFKTLFDNYDGIQKWFVHIDTDGIFERDKTITRDLVKGLDDLLITYADKTKEIIDDLQALHEGRGKYFQKFNITFKWTAAYRHFHIKDVNEFFVFHVERRPELQNKVFKYAGTLWKWSEEHNTCEVQMPGESQLYFRVGDNYFKWILKPNQYGKDEKVFVSRQKSTIVDDHGKNFCKHIPKYEDFCNVPNHSDYKQIINNCFNVYSQLDHEPDDEKCTQEDIPSIIGLLKHLFGDKPAKFKDKAADIEFECKTWELALDYLQLLYMNPSQKLPILCLVSKENNTGKSTFGFFLREFLGANTAVVGNADLSSDFNAHWATKSVVVVDEAKIDKHQVIEKIKMLSTARKIYMNAKGRGQVELDCFIKFVLITNNEDSFVTATEEDTRYWVHKVPRLTSDDPRMLKKLVEEIPQLMSYLSTRTMATSEVSRFWFHYDLLQTDALKNLIRGSEATVVKELRQALKDLFLDTGEETIMMTANAILKELLPKKIELNYLHRVLQDKLRVKKYHEWEVEGVDRLYMTEQEAIAAAEVKYPDHTGHLILGKIKAIEKTCRHTYPIYIEKYENSTKTRELVHVKDNGRPYVFKRMDFVTAEENARTRIDPETAAAAAPADNSLAMPAAPVATGTELPFGNPEDFKNKA